MATKHLVFIDTNILLSGIVFPGGNEYKILNFCLQSKFDLILCQAVLEEAKRVFNDKFPSHKQQLTKFVNKSKHKTAAFPTKSEIAHYEGFLKDKFDLPILVSAIKSNPDYFITGDKGFYMCKNKVDFKILSSREFLGLIN